MSFPWSRNAGFKEIGPCAPLSGGPERARVQILDHASQLLVVHKSGRQKNWTMRGPGQWSIKAEGKRDGPRTRVPRGPRIAQVKILDHAVQFSVVQECGIQRDRTMRAPEPRSRNSAGSDPGPRRAVFCGPKMRKAKEMDHARPRAVVQNECESRTWTTPRSFPWSRNAGFKEIEPRIRVPQGPETARDQIPDHAAQFSVVQKCGRQESWTTHVPGRWSRNSADQDPGPRRAVFCGPKMRKAKEMDHAWTRAVVHKSGR